MQMSYEPPQAVQFATEHGRQVELSSAGPKESRQDDPASQAAGLSLHELHPSGLQEHQQAKGKALVCSCSGARGRPQQVAHAADSRQQTAAVPPPLPPTHHLAQVPFWALQPESQAVQFEGVAQSTQACGGEEQRFRQGLLPAWPPCSAPASAPRADTRRTCGSRHPRPCPSCTGRSWWRSSRRCSWACTACSGLWCSQTGPGNIPNI